MFLTAPVLELCLLKLLFQIFEKANPADQQVYTVSLNSSIEGVTLSNVLYVMFYSDYSVNYRSFNITYRHIEGIVQF